MDTRRIVYWIILMVLVLTGCVPKPDLEEAKPTPDIVASIEAQPTITKEATPEPTPSATPEPTTTPTPKRYTAILLGEDHYGTGTGSRTDTFIILTYIDKWNDLLIINVPRDLYVEYGGQAKVFCNPPSEFDRINRAYALGSFDCVRAVVDHNFGLVVNAGVAVVDFDGFVELVDQLGGLLITPSKYFSCHVKSFEADYEYWAIWRPAHTYLLSGEQLLCYVRERMISGGIDRDRRGQEVILAMKDQWLADMEMDEIANLLPFTLERVKVDVPLEDIVSTISLAKQIILGDVNIRTVVFQYDQEVTPHTTDLGAWVFRPLVDLKGWMTCLLGGHSSEICSWKHALEEAE